MSKYRKLAQLSFLISEWLQSKNMMPHIFNTIHPLRVKAGIPSGKGDLGKHVIAYTPFINYLKRVTAKLDIPFPLADVQFYEAGGENLYPILLGGDMDVPQITDIISTVYNNSELLIWCAFAYSTIIHQAKVKEQLSLKDYISYAKSNASLPKELQSIYNKVVDIDFDRIYVPLIATEFNKGNKTIYLNLIPKTLNYRYLQDYVIAANLSNPISWNNVSRTILINNDIMSGAISYMANIPIKVAAKSLIGPDDMKLSESMPEIKDFIPEKYRTYTIRSVQNLLFFTRTDIVQKIINLETGQKLRISDFLTPIQFMQGLAFYSNAKELLTGVVARDLLCKAMGPYYGKDGVILPDDSDHPKSNRAPIEPYKRYPWNRTKIKESNSYGSKERLEYIIAEHSASMERIKAELPDEKYKIIDDPAGKILLKNINAPLDADIIYDYFAALSPLSVIYSAFEVAKGSLGIPKPSRASIERYKRYPWNQTKIREFNSYGSKQQKMSSITGWPTALRIPTDGNTVYRSVSTTGISHVRPYKGVLYLTDRGYETSIMINFLSIASLAYSLFYIEEQENNE